MKEPELLPMSSACQQSLRIYFLNHPDHTLYLVARTVGQWELGVRGNGASGFRWDMKGSALETCLVQGLLPPADSIHYVFLPNGRLNQTRDTGGVHWRWRPLLEGE